MNRLYFVGGSYSDQDDFPKGGCLGVVCHHPTKDGSRWLVYKKPECPANERIVYYRLGDEWHCDTLEEAFRIAFERPGLMTAFTFGGTCTTAEWHEAERRMDSYLQERRSA